MKCALCKRDTDLRDSHIISSFNYKPLRQGEKPNFYELPTDSSESRAIVQDGPKEKLLCPECEQLRSKWERYFSLLWYDGRLFADTYPVTILNVEYPKLKLYQMSTLYLAAVSQHDFFQQVRMTEEREEQLRKMLLSSSPGPSAEFGCAMYAIAHDEITDERSIVSSGHTRQWGELRIHLFTFAGFLWIHVDGDTDLISPDLKARFVRRSNRLRIDGIDPTDIALLRESFDDLREQGKLEDPL